MQEFFSEIASAGFFKRLFSWKKIKAKADVAQSEWKMFEARQRELEEVKMKLAVEETENRARQRELEEVKMKLAVEEANYQRKAENLDTLIQQMENQRREDERRRRRVLLCATEYRTDDSVG